MSMKDEKESKQSLISARTLYSILCIGFALCLISETVRAQFQVPLLESPDRTAVEGNALVSSYAVELGSYVQPFEGEKFLGKASAPSSTADAGKKSRIIAAGLSLLVPGLGEYYVGDQIWRGMIFTGVEIGLWAERVHWTHRGDDSTTAFRDFSNAHWSPGKYIKYLDSDLTVHHFSDSCNCFATSTDLHSINHAEATLDSFSIYGSDPSVQNFTHRLPLDDIQQYYEIISKYLQFVQGWDDAIGPNFSDSKNMTRAADLRADANYQYAVADYFLWGVIVNHVLSAIDAAILASSHNSSLHLQGNMLLRPFPNGALGYVPTAKIEYTF